MPCFPFGWPFQWALEWDGYTRPAQPERLIREACEAVFGAAVFQAYRIARAFDETWLLEPQLLRRHGLMGGGSSTSSSRTGRISMS